MIAVEVRRMKRFLEERGREEYKWNPQVGQQPFQPNSRVGDSTLTLRRLMTDADPVYFFAYATFKHKKSLDTTEHQLFKYFVLELETGNFLEWKLV